MKTYTKRTNAKRAAIAAGISADEVEITVHKEAGQPARFGYSRKAQQAAPKAAPAERRSMAAQPAGSPRVERNGVKRPRAGGLCAQVWSWLDDHKDATLADVREWAMKKGLNQNNASIELYAWRRFNAPSGRATKVA